MLRKCVEEIPSPNRKRLRQFNYVLQRYVALPTLHAADIISVKTGSFRKLLLRVAAILPKGPHCCPEDLFVRSFSHPLMLGV